MILVALSYILQRFVIERAIENVQSLELEREGNKIPCIRWEEIFPPNTGKLVPSLKSCSYTGVTRGIVARMRLKTSRRLVNFLEYLNNTDNLETEKTKHQPGRTKWGGGKGAEFCNEGIASWRMHRRRRGVRRGRKAREGERESSR